jgi:NADH dehydrogenase
MKIAVTGSTGYIGRRLMRAAAKQGHYLYSLSRCPSDVIFSTWVYYNLASTESLDFPGDIDVFVHLAANTSFKSDLSGDQEITAAKKIIDLACSRGIKFIFISSQTARENAPTEYGRTKFKIEKLVINSGGIVIRPGLVYGGPSYGLYGELVNLVKKSFVLPCFLPSPRIQPIHVDDLAIGILKVAEYSSVNIGPVVMLGSVNSISFNYFLSAIASFRLHKLRIQVPFPSLFIRLLAGFFERIGGGINRLNSLFNLTDMHTKDDLDLLALNLRSLSSGLNISGSNRRRQLILEGLALHAYIMGMSIKKINMRNYVRIIEQLRDGLSLQLPFGHHTWLLWIILLDNKHLKLTPWIEEFKWRLRAAILLAEASTTGAKYFINPNGSGFISSFFGIFTALVTELAVKVCGFFLAPLMRLVLSKKLKCSHES